MQLIPKGLLAANKKAGHVIRLFLLAIIFDDQNRRVVGKYFASSSS